MRLNKQEGKKALKYLWVVRIKVSILGFHRWLNMFCGVIGNIVIEKMGFDPGLKS